jgi:hypothetical protein
MKWGPLMRVAYINAWAIETISGPGQDVAT